MTLRGPTVDTVRKSTRGRADTSFIPGGRGPRASASPEVASSSAMQDGQRHARTSIVNSKVHLDGILRSFFPSVFFIRVIALCGVCSCGEAVEDFCSSAAGSVHASLFPARTSPSAREDVGRGP